MPSFPFSQSGVSSMSRSLLKNKLTFNGIVTNIEKTVSTINQVVPLYNQVKPLINNSKTLIQGFKSLRKDTKSKKKRNNRYTSNINMNNENIINVDIQETKFSSPINEEKEKDIDYFVSNDAPNKPFIMI